jgi:hypothetical protein
MKQLRFFKKTAAPKVNLEEHEMLEYAQNRVSQRKWLYQHMVIFAIGSVFLILANKILKYGEAYDWYAWVMLLWGFLLALHAFNVLVAHKFMGKDWERRQREILVARQKEKIAELQKEIQTDFPLSKVNKKETIEQ